MFGKDRSLSPFYNLIAESLKFNSHVLTTKYAHSNAHTRTRTYKYTRTSAHFFFCLGDTVYFQHKGTTSLFSKEQKLVFPELLVFFFLSRLLFLRRAGAIAWHTSGRCLKINRLQEDGNYARTVLYNDLDITRGKLLPTPRHVTWCRQVCGALCLTKAASADRL